jgi:two-component system cell cycle sensor histidine kinase/response regulator CckA
MEAIGQLAGGVAHDFNNLLCVIIGYSECLLNGLPTDNPQCRFIQEIKNAGDRAASLTRQLLAFSRKQVLVPTVLSLNALVTSIERLLDRLIGEDIELTTALEPALEPIKADAGQIEQVIMNLAVNARDAMPMGGKLSIRTANVRLDAADLRKHPEVVPGPYTLLEVADNGCGMTPDVIARIFEPFFTTKEVGKGTGLGLATVYGVVKQSGGHIEVNSAPGHGTTFKVYLPCVAGQAAPTLVDATVAKLPRGTETILLVEDEHGVRGMVREVLATCGYEVIEASNGAEAMDAVELHKGNIHLLLTDVVMPRMSGGNAAQLLVALRPSMKVLFMSGYTDSNLVRNGISNGEVDCIFKPFKPDALACTVREVLDRKDGRWRRPKIAAPAPNRN